MLKRLMSLFTTERTEEPSTELLSISKKMIVRDVRVFERVTVDDTLNHHDSDLKMLNINLGITPEEFDRYVIQTLRRIAMYVLNVPATGQLEYSEEYGRFHKQMLIANACVRLSESIVISTREPGELKAKIDKLWRLVCFTGGILYDLIDHLNNVQITNGKKPNWTPLTESMVTYLNRETKVGKFYVSWSRPDDYHNHHIVSSLIHNLISPELYEYIVETKKELWFAILESFQNTPETHMASMLSNLYRESVESVERHYYRYTRGVKRQENSIENESKRFIVFGIRRCLTELWRPNEPGSILWITEQGIFADWDKAFDAIQQELKTTTLSSVRITQADVLDALKSSYLVKPAPAGTFFWSVSPELDESATISMVCIHFSPQAWMDYSNIKKIRATIEEYVKPPPLDTSKNDGSRDFIREDAEESASDQENEKTTDSVQAENCNTVEQNAAEESLKEEVTAVQSESSNEDTKTLSNQDQTQDGNDDNPNVRTKNIVNDNVCDASFLKWCKSKGMAGNILKENLCVAADQCDYVIELDNGDWGLYYPEAIELAGISGENGLEDLKSKFLIKKNGPSEQSYIVTKKLFGKEQQLIILSKTAKKVCEKVLARSPANV